ncbi:MAG: hypothetical protein RSE13_22425 [Planktothrix sp. GU0601_MAG3]|nr:MAG: hypothetical protein RSE13_22425 [Planktothrix sp. GU0601_MAG3]
MIYVTTLDEFPTIISDVLTSQKPVINLIEVRGLTSLGFWGQSPMIEYSKSEGVSQCHH